MNNFSFTSYLVAKKPGLQSFTCCFVVGYIQQEICHDKAGEDATEALMLLNRSLVCCFELFLNPLSRPFFHTEGNGNLERKTHSLLFIAAQSKQSIPGEGITSVTRQSLILATCFICKALYNQHSSMPKADSHGASALTLLIYFE